MFSPLLATKLYIPPVRQELVSRPRLIEQLNAGLDRKLTLVSAPAGFGKTTLVTEWLGSIAHPRAWLSLDEGDNDPARFLAYLIAALQNIDSTIGRTTQAMLQNPQPPPPESLLTTLINDVADTPNPFILILDDYHLIEAQPIHDTLTFLLEHLPPQMHLGLATREDPPLPLARLRQLTELRAADLRFTPAEAAEFLTQVMGLNLSAEDVAALETRTEGWIAGLQMAALALQGLALQGTLSTQRQADTASFIRAFTGSHRFVLDYLVEEVLQRQPERVRSFLLQTSILDRLCGPLCDAVCSVGTANSSKGTAVTGQRGKEILEALERGNLFIVPLDDRRRWYRYHHLLADVLQAHLMEKQPHQVPALHLRASEWYEQNDLPADAIHHALAIEDFERAAGLIELTHPAMDISFQLDTWLGWVKALPDELLRARPVLSVAYAQALMDAGELEACESRLRDAERWLDPTGGVGAWPESSSDGMIVVDKEQFHSLPAKIALARANYAQIQGDTSATIKYAELALKRTPEQDHVMRSLATVLLGFTHWASGDLEVVNRSFADFATNMVTAGNILFAIATSGYLAEIMVAQGRLREAERTYKQALQLAAEQDEHVQRVTAHLYLGLAMLYREMGDQKAAAQHLQKSEELGDQMVLVDWPYRWCLAQARLKEAEGDLEATLDLLNEAKRQYVRNPVPDIRPIEALKARVYIRQGRLAEALAWACERSLSVDDELSYLREFEHVTLARVLIAKCQKECAERSVVEAIGLLERLLKAAEESRRMSSVIEILVVQALAHQAQSNIPSALASLERALTLAKPEGYVQLFVDEGPPMVALLREAMKHGIFPNYVSQLQAAFGKAEGRTPITQSLIEPLSRRELEVLKLLETELNGPEIAHELMVSLNTMRTHTKNIYSKLGVNNRRAAVRRAEELDLL